MLEGPDQRALRRISQGNVATGQPSKQAEMGASRQLQVNQNRQPERLQRTGVSPNNLWVCASALCKAGQLLETETFTADPRFFPRAGTEVLRETRQIEIST